VEKGRNPGNGENRNIDEIAPPPHRCAPNVCINGGNACASHPPCPSLSLSFSCLRLFLRALFPPFLLVPSVPLSLFPLPVRPGPSPKGTTVSASPLDGARRYSCSAFPTTHKFPPTNRKSRDNPAVNDGSMRREIAGNCVNSTR